MSHDLCLEANPARAEGQRILLLYPLLQSQYLRERGGASWSCCLLPRQENPWQHR